jgi:HD-like signal output (HDOD) protein
MNRLETIRRIVEEADRGELVFPTNVRAAIKLQQALNEPDCHLETAAQLVLAEPLVAARVVSIANSVAYTRYGAKVDNVRNAVQLLGFKTLRALVAAIIVRQFSGGIADPALREKADRLWLHCAHVAALAKVLAGRVRGQDADTAMFAGIVHEIGGFYLLSRAEELPVLLDAGSGEEDFALTRGILGILMVPKTVVAAVLELWEQAHNLPPVLLGDTLALANRLSPVSSPLEPASGAESAPEIPDVALQGKKLQAILAESGGEIQSLTDMLLA